jgi:hypothetical protein
MSDQTYIWEAEGQPLRVCLSLIVVRQLSLEALEALKAVPRRGLEIGGILLGPVKTEEQGTTLEVEAYQAVLSEHRSGPSYRLSEVDLAHLDQTIGNYQEIAGFYRTHTRSEELESDAEDLAILQRCCTGRPGIFLLIQPARGMAAFFLPEDGRLLLRHEFPFRTGDLPTREAATSELVEKLPTRPRVITTAAVAAPVGTRPSKRWTWIARTAAVLVGFGLGALWWWHSSRRAPETPPAPRPALAEPVMLRLEREGRSLRVKWEGNALHAATHGTLYIEDGNHQSRIDLEPRELAFGSLSYWPDTGSVLFRLEVQSAQGGGTGILRVIGGQPATGPPASEAKAPVSPEPAARRPVERPKGAAAREEEEGGRPSPFRSPELTPKTSVPSASQASAQPGALPIAPPPTIPEPVSQPTAHKSDPPAYVTVVAEPVTSSFVGRVVGKIPLVRRLKKPQTFVPPKPKRQVQPVLTAEEQHSLRKDTPLDVKVYVTDEGKVEFAEIRGHNDHPTLASASLTAARRWSFTPARLGEENVAGEVILHFEFHSRQGEAR